MCADKLYSGSGTFKALYGTAVDDVWAGSQWGEVFHFDGIAWSEVAGVSSSSESIWVSRSGAMFHGSIASVFEGGVSTDLTNAGGELTFLRLP